MDSALMIERFSAIGNKVVNIISLPLEVIESICNHLSREDLKKSRLVSRQFENAAQRVLFRTIFLKVNLRSFERLQYIAENAKLSKHVRAISYDASRVCGCHAADGFKQWYHHTAATGLGFFDFLGEKRDDFLAQFTICQLERYYFKFCLWFSGQEYLLGNDNWKKQLVNALCDLPGVSEIDYSACNHGWQDSDDIRHELPPLSSLSPMAREILAEPSIKIAHQDSNETFWSLLDSASEAGHAKQIRKVSGVDLDLETWDQIAAIFEYNFGMLSGLQHLSLQFEKLSEENFADIASLSTTIAAATSMRSLCLIFDHQSLYHMTLNRFSRDGHHTINRHFRHVSLQEILKETQWQHLRSLELYGVIATEEELKSVITRHASTIRHFKLSHSDLELSTVPSEYNRTSWIYLIKCLQPSMFLEYVAFDRVSTSLAHEWNAEGIQWRFWNQYTACAFCGCCPSGNMINKMGVKFQDGSNMPWLFGDFQGWYDSNRHELCVCDDDYF